MTEEEKDSAKVLERLIMFNDAVFAIALTLLVLELKLPEGIKSNDPAALWHALVETGPKFLAFLMSAILVGGNWISSISIQRLMVRSDLPLVVTMIIYLIIISLMPFCCNLLGAYPDNPFTYVIFGIVMELLCINAVFFMRHSRKANLYHPDANLPAILQLEKSVFFVIIFIAAIAAVSFYSTRLSFILFLIYNTLPFFLTRSLRINHKEVIKK